MWATGSSSPRGLAVSVAWYDASSAALLSSAGSTGLRRMSGSACTRPRPCATGTAYGARWRTRRRESAPLAGGAEISASRSGPVDAAGLEEATQQTDGRPQGHRGAGQVVTLDWSLLTPRG